MNLEDKAVELLAKIEAVAPSVYAAALERAAVSARVDAFLYGLGLVIAAACCVVFVRSGSKFLAVVKADRDSPRYDQINRESEAAAPICFFSGFGTLLFGLMSSLGMADAVRNLLSPEFFAIRLLMSLVR